MRKVAEHHRRYNIHEGGLYGKVGAIFAKIRSSVDQRNCFHKRSLILSKISGWFTSGIFVVQSLLKIINLFFRRVESFRG